jgi:hypothetical protein
VLVRAISAHIARDQEEEEKEEEEEGRHRFRGSKNDRTVIL